MSNVQCPISNARNRHIGPFLPVSLSPCLLVCLSDELARKPVEQLGVGRRLTLRAEVLRRLHQPAPEEDRPEAIHRDAACERMVRPCEPFSQSQPVAREVLWKRQNRR